MLTVFWDIKELITVNFLEKGPTVNIANLPYSLNGPSIMKNLQNKQKTNGLDIYPDIKEIL